MRASRRGAGAFRISVSVGLQSNDVMVAEAQEAQSREKEWKRRCKSLEGIGIRAFGSLPEGLQDSGDAAADDEDADQIVHLSAAFPPEIGGQ